MKEERKKQLMKDFGMPNSRSLLILIEQVGQGYGMEQFKAGMLHAAEIAGPINTCSAMAIRKEAEGE